MTPNRIVVLVSPIFIGLAGWVCELSARYLPGAPQLDRDQLTAVFILGSAAASAKVLSWLKGWRDHEARAARRTASERDRDREDRLERVRNAERDR